LGVSLERPTYSKSSGLSQSSGGSLDGPNEIGAACEQVTAELKDEVNLSNLNFFSDSQLKERLSATSATPEQMTEALQINAEALTRALKTGFLVLSGLTLLAVVPCWWLPPYRPDEIPSTSSPVRSKSGKT
jgi:hypothetical protein